MQRLGKNIGGYFGEPLNLAEVAGQIETTAAEKNWVRDVVPLEFPATVPPCEFVAYRRAAAAARINFYISAGIHGDEPAGPLAVLQLLLEDQWPDGVNLWLCPLLNPTGLAVNKRENFEGIDLNRDYRGEPKSREVKTHIAWLARQPRFDLTICLHEDWESNGFYVYEVNPDNKPSIAEKIISATAAVCPIESSGRVDDWESNKGIVRPNINPEERPQWPEALYLLVNKTRMGCTLEAPSDFPLPTRVRAHVAAVRAVLALL